MFPVLLIQALFVRPNQSQCVTLDRGYLILPFFIKRNVQKDDIFGEFGILDTGNGILEYDPFIRDSHNDKLVFLIKNEVRPDFIKKERRTYVPFSDDYGFHRVYISEDFLHITTI